MGKLRICITGAGGFIASHLAMRLKKEGHYIVGCDWKRNDHMTVCHSFAAEYALRLVRKALALTVLLATGGHVLQRVHSGRSARV